MAEKKRGKKEPAPTPKRIVPGKGVHRTETRFYDREVGETFCVQPGCKFRGERARQGFCYDVPRRDVYDALFDVGERYAEELAATYREYFRGRPRKYVRHLESSVICWYVNSTSLLDQLVAMRRENALLRKEVERLRGRKLTRQQWRRFTETGGRS